MGGAPAGRLRPSYALGAALAILAGGALSTGGVIVREIDEAGGWQILFYRSLAVVVVISVFVALRSRGAVWASYRGVGWPGLAYALALGLAFTAFVQAVTLTAVANVAVMISTQPLFAAAAAWLVLRERVHPTIWAAIALALTGIGVMLGGAVEGGGLLGNLVALGVPGGMAVVLLAVRVRPRTDMMPAVALAGLVGMTVAAAASGGALAAPWGDAGLAMLMGLIQIALGFALINLAARWIPAADVGLYELSEIPLAPLWVWASVNEVPTTLTFVGGGIVVTAVVTAMLRLRRETIGTAGL